MRIALREGRAFNAADRQSGPGVCIVNESLAKRLFPGESAIGKIMLRGKDAEIKSAIVGVIRDVRTIGLSVPPPDEDLFSDAAARPPRHGGGGANGGEAGIAPGRAAGSSDHRGQGPADLLFRDARLECRRRASASSASSRRSRSCSRQLRWCCRPSACIRSRVCRLAAHDRDRHPDGARREARAR